MAAMATGVSAVVFVLDKCPDLVLRASPQRSARGKLRTHIFPTVVSGVVLPQISKKRLNEVEILMKGVSQRYGTHLIIMASVLLEMYVHVLQILSL